LKPSNLGYSDALDTLWWNDVLDFVHLNRPVKQIDMRNEIAIVTASIGALQS